MDSKEGKLIGFFQFFKNEGKKNSLEKFQNLGNIFKRKPPII